MGIENIAVRSWWECEGRLAAECGRRSLGHVSKDTITFLQFTFTVTYSYFTVTFTVTVTGHCFFPFFKFFLCNCSMSCFRACCNSWY